MKLLSFPCRRMPGPQSFPIPHWLWEAERKDAVRYTLLPVLKARSIRPCGMLSWGNGKAERAGEKELEKEYPGIRNWGAEFGECPVRQWRLRPGNALVLEDFPVPLRTGIRQDRNRVLSWECRGRRFLMIGNTGFSSLARAEKTPRAGRIAHRASSARPGGQRGVDQGHRRPRGHFHDGA